MNVENILKVADAIEQNSIKHFDFNMCEIAEVNMCGTSACIAGYALALKNSEFKELPHTSGAYAEAAAEAGDFLGIPQEKYDPLFFPDSDGGPDGTGWFYDLGGITKGHAVAVLRHLAATGVVDWDVSE